MERTVHGFKVKDLRIIRTYPVTEGTIFLVFRLREHAKNSGVTRKTAAIFRWASPFTCETNRQDRVWIQR
jgi:hypothetical protein